MTFLKSLMLVIIATVFLTYVFGSSILELLNINVTMNGEVVEPLKAISVSAIIGVILVMAALAIVLSIFGGLIFIGIMLLGTIAMMTVGVFWPVLLLAIVFWFFSRDKTIKQTA